MLIALIGGERDSKVLAEHAHGRMRPKIGVLAEALTGRFGDHHAFLCRTMLDLKSPARSPRSSSGCGLAERLSRPSGSR
jgi:hypothetical protein